jgi:1-acyl-sn-glycerol-3-phosphate acyltransferase
MELVAPACHGVLRVVLRVLADWRVLGRERVPARGPFILVANHQSNIDPPLLGASLGRPARFLAKASLFSNPLATAFFRGYGAFPVRRDGADLAASRWALRCLREGHALVLFPEGGRSPGSLRRAQPGVAYLALAARVPILPAAITGTERLGGPLWRVALPTGKLTVTFPRAVGQIPLYYNHKHLATKYNCQ